MGLPLECADHSQLSPRPSPKPLKASPESPEDMPLLTRFAGAARAPLAVLALLPVLGACSYLPTLPTSETFSVSGDKVLGLMRPYRVEIVQGNVLTKEQLERVKPGMSRAQVRDLLGSPLLTDLFHGERWDYVFTIRRQGVVSQSRQVVALFEGDKLKSIAAPDDLPTEKEFIASINTFKPSGPAPKLELSEAERQALPKPVRPEAAAVEPMGAVRAYPPLEPRS